MPSSQKLIMKHGICIRPALQHSKNFWKMQQSGRQATPHSGACNVYMAFACADRFCVTRYILCHKGDSENDDSLHKNKSMVIILQ